jgi:hypothetical protein
VFLEVWQGKELQADFLKVWQPKGLEGKKKELGKGALTGGTARGACQRTPYYYGISVTVVKN